MPAPPRGTSSHGPTGRSFRTAFSRRYQGYEKFSGVSSPDRTYQTFRAKRRRADPGSERTQRHAFRAK